MERTLLHQFQWTASTEAWSNRVKMDTALLRRSVAKALERKRQDFGLRPTKSKGKGGDKGSIKYIK